MILRAGIWAVALGMSACGLRGEETAPPPPAPAEAAPENWPAIRDETFEMVWKTVNESYFDATFGGVDWKATGDKYRALLPQTGDKEALRRLLGAMLGELRKTHFAILPREMSVFTPAERSRLGTIGLGVTWVGTAVAVETVDEESAAAAAGIRPGDEVVQVDNLELPKLAVWLEQYEPVPARRANALTQLVATRLQGPVGSVVSLQLRPAGGEERRLELAFAERGGTWSEPAGDQPSVPVRVNSRCEPGGLGYLRFNVFTREVMKDFRALVRQLPADGGLVLDLRGNPGGLTLMAPGMSGWLSDKRFPLGTMQLRQGYLGYMVNPQAGAFLGPVALLIDSGSASTSEILAAGLQETGRVRIFGEHSPGAALPSLLKALPTGDILQHAIADLQTPKGRLIEGEGVTPDEVVVRTTADLAGGRDPVLEAARHWIDAERTTRRPEKPAGTP